MQPHQKRTESMQRSQALKDFAPKASTSLFLAARSDPATQVTQHTYPQHGNTLKPIKTPEEFTNKQHRLGVIEQELKTFGNPAFIFEEDE